MSCFRPTMRNHFFFLPVFLLFLLTGCGKQPFDSTGYIHEKKLEKPSDMTDEHWSKLLDNVPKEYRLEIIEKLEAVHEAAVHRAESLRKEGESWYATTVRDLIEPQWRLSLIHIANGLRKYPVVYDSSPNKKSEYWRHTAKDIIRYLDDRLEFVKHWDFKTGGDSTDFDRRMTFTQSRRFVLDKEEKSRLEYGEAFTVNPYLALPDLRMYGGLQSSWNHPNHPAQKLMFEKRNKELEQFKVDATPELAKLDLRIGDIQRWDGSTSLQPVARIVVAHAAEIPWRWRKPGEYHSRDGGEVVLTDHYAWSFDDEVGSNPEENYNRHLERSYPSYDAFDPATGNLKEIRYPPDAKPSRDFINGHKFSQTHKAYVNLIEGRRDLIFATRMPSEDELESAKEQGIELEFFPFARDAFVFLTNRHNPVRDLTLKQVQDIFSGKVKRWKNIGGFGGTVKPLIRDRNSGSEELMRTLVMKDVPVQSDFKHQLLALMSGIFDVLEHNIEGIGYSILYYERYMVCNPYTRTLRINGIEPTPETIVDGSYPLLYDCVAVVRKDSPKKARAVACWLAEDEGAKVVRESGYIPVSKQNDRLESIRQVR